VQQLDGVQVLRRVKGSRGERGARGWLSLAAQDDGKMHVRRVMNFSRRFLLQGEQPAWDVAF